MRVYSLELLIALPEPLRFRQTTGDQYRRLIAQLTALQHVTATEIYERPLVLSVSRTDENAIVNRGVKLHRTPSAISFDWEVFSLAGTIAVDTAHYLVTFRRNNPERTDIPEDEVITFIPGLLEADLEKFFGDFVLACQIAIPGSADRCSGYAVVDGHLEGSFSVGPASVEAAFQEAGERSWPTLIELPVHTVLTWLGHVPGMSDGVPSEKVGHALSALSHILCFEGDTPGSVALMWCMLGLEALLVGSREGLSNQMLERAQAILGPIAEGPREFKNLYNFRSRFVHGDLDVPLAYSPYDGAKARESFSDDSYQAELRACAMLVATLQQLAASSAYLFEFKTIAVPLRRQ
jgi:hypothetical protein